MKKILYIDMDIVLVDFKSALPRVSEETKAQYDGHLDDIHGIYSLMDPMPGAIEAYITLSERFDTYVLSTSPWENPSAWSDKLNWVKKHLGKPAYKRLILTHHKNLNTGHFLIDDRTTTGADRFTGEHIHFGSEKFPDWRAVVEYLGLKQKN
jgi:5'-nucleotidase